MHDAYICVRFWCIVSLSVYQAKVIDLLLLSIVRFDLLASHIDEPALLILVS
jgi:hypothetical protein